MNKAGGTTGELDLKGRWGWFLGAATVPSSTGRRELTRPGRSNENSLPGRSCGSLGGQETLEVTKHTTSSSLNHQALESPEAISSQMETRENQFSFHFLQAQRTQPSCIISLEAHLGLAGGDGPSGGKVLCVVREVISLDFTAPRAMSGQSCPRKSEAENVILRGSLTSSLEWPWSGPETTSGCTQSLKRQRSIPRSREPSRQPCAPEESGCLAATSDLGRGAWTRQLQECHCEMSLRKDKLPTMTTGTILTWGWGR